ncbi:MAG: CvpA family protein [Acidobacteriia bacterium]|nr:CvpA family protein [Terriglobia bacterium]
MTGADWLIIAVILFSVLVAAAQGFMYEVFSLAGVVAGYLFAAWGYRQVAPWYMPYVKTPWVADLCGFLSIFFVVVLLAGGIGRIARFGMKEAGLRWFDRVLGGMFGLVRGVALVMVFVLALASFSPGSTLLARSRTAPYLLVLARAAVWVAPSQVRQQFRAGMDAIANIRRGVPPAANGTAAPGPSAVPAK